MPDLRVVIQRLNTRCPNRVGSRVPVPLETNASGIWTVHYDAGVARASSTHLGVIYSG